MKKYLIFWAECQICFTKYEFLDTAEGTQQLRHPKNMRNAVEVSWFAPVFKDIGNRVDRFIAHKQMKTIPAARVFFAVFGELCDPAEDGYHYQMNGPLWCPKCGSKDRSRHAPIEPPQFWEGELPQVSHTHWDSLSDAEKDAAVEKEIDKLGI